MLPPPSSALLGEGRLLLGLILVIAMIVRIAGLRWGLPNELHYFSYHPDESVVMLHSVASMGGLDLVHGQFLPHFYNYGTLQLALISFATAVAVGYHALGPIFNATGGVDTSAFDLALLIARTITVVMGVGTVWATFAIGKRLWGVATGLVAAAVLALMPLHMQHSHFATVDVPATFWTTLAILWAVKALDSPQAWKPLLASGLFVGLATATKYNCALAILAPLVAGHCRGYATSVTSERLREAAGAIGAVVAAAVAFVAACPGVVLDTAKFLADLQFEKVHVYQEPEIYFQQTGPGWLYIVAHNLSAGMGWIWLAATLGGIAYALVKRERGDGILGFFALAYFLLISLAASRYARYEIPLLPIAALWGARLIADFAQKTVMARVVSALIVAASVGSMAVLDGALLGPMMGTDIRDQIAVRLNAQTPPPASIAFASTPWFWSPPLSPYFTMPAPWQWERFSHSPSLLYNREKPFDLELLKARQPEIVLMSEYEYYDRLRVNDPDATAYVHYLLSYYELDLYSTDMKRARRMGGLPYSGLPHDMMYTNPVTLVFKRNHG